MNFFQLRNFSINLSFEARYCENENNDKIKYTKSRSNSRTSDG